jgi:hypothetical protein
MVGGVLRDANVIFPRGNRHCFFEAPGIESLAASIWLLNIFMYFEEFLGASWLRFKPLCSLLASYYSR